MDAQSVLTTTRSVRKRLDLQRPVPQFVAADPVAHYLDQAYRSRTRGAYTAAVAMYRAALEQFLHARGYAKGRLVDRIADAVNELKRNNL